MIPGRALLVLSVALIALPVFAQSSDLETWIDAPATTRPGETYTFSGTVTNKGPDPAEHVQIYMQGGWMAPCYDGIDIGTLAVGAVRTFNCTVAVPDPVPGYQLGVSFAALTDTDPEGGNNNAFYVAMILTPADLRAWAYAYTPTAPGLKTTMRVEYTNMAHAAAEQVTLRLTTAGTFASVPAFCTASGGTAVCNLGRLEPFGSAYEPKFFTVEVIAPDASAAHFDLKVEISGSDDPNPADNVYTAPAVTYRTFFVTSTGDEGNGSLRQSIENANAECIDTWPCLIAFRIPTAAATQWHSIRPAEPLPAILGASVTIDGTTQADYFLDSNPAGPEIELSGSALASGTGIAIVAGCTSAVRGLTINGFPTSAIHVASAAGCDARGGYPGQPFSYQRAVEKNYIGTDPTGKTAVPNGLGVYVDGSNAGWTVSANVIGGNRRSGVFVDAGLNLVVRNTIGLTADITAPLGNEASGIYIGPRASGTDVTDNYIAFNHHFGVAIDRDAQNVALLGNSFQANHQLAIDRGLDGVTTTGIPLPIIASAHYADGITQIEIVTGNVGGTFDPVVRVYANDAADPSGYGEGQYFLGEAAKTDTQRYVMRYEGDLRGKWIAATSTRVVYNGWLRAPRITTNGDTGWGYLTTTSEFGRALEVK